MQSVTWPVFSQHLQCVANSWSCLKRGKRRKAQTLRWQDKSQVRSGHGICRPQWVRCPTQAPLPFQSKQVKSRALKQVTMRKGSGQAINFPRTFDSRSSIYLWGRKSDSEKTNEKDGFKSGGWDGGNHHCTGLNTIQSKVHVFMICFTRCTFAAPALDWALTHTGVSFPKAPENSSSPSSFRGKRKVAFIRKGMRCFVPFLRRALLTTLDIPWLWSPEQNPREVI